MRLTARRGCATIFAMNTFLLALMLLTGMTILSAKAVGDDGGVPEARLAKLTRGINLSHWFAQAGDYSGRHQDTYNTAKDAALLWSMGFRHVRFTFNDATVVNAGSPTALDSAKMRRFDAAMDMLLGSGLAVIVDFHPEDDFKNAVATNDVAVKDFVGMWRALAKHLSVRDPEMVFLETMNEPVLGDAARWNSIQKQVLAAMRESAPFHTLIASGPRWSGVEELERVEVIADRNVVYNFHCYEPFIFTHQGATWAGSWVKGLRNVPYPSDPEGVAKAAASVPEGSDARRYVTQYGQDKWNATRLESVIARAAAWGRKHGVALTCNEFGVYRAFSQPADRHRCIADLRKACEKHNIGWCMWDYAGGFAVAPGKPGERSPDSDTVSALGLEARVK